MFGADVETVYEDDEIIVMRLSWWVNGEYQQKMITEHKEGASE